MPDFLHPLQRDRQILVEALRQVTYLSRVYRENNLNPEPFLEEARRLGDRLIEIQQKIEKQDLD